MSMSYEQSNISSIGSLILSAHQNKGLTQMDLAKLLADESAQVTSDWERGNASTPLTRLTDISKHLDINFDQLFESLLNIYIDRVTT